MLARAGHHRAGRQADHGHVPRASSERAAEHRCLSTTCPAHRIIPRSGRHGSRPFVSIKDGRMPVADEAHRRAGPPALSVPHPGFGLDGAGRSSPSRRQRRRDEYSAEEEGNSSRCAKGSRKLATRAFRRPVTDEELERLCRHRGSRRSKAGEKFPERGEGGHARDPVLEELHLPRRGRREARCGTR